MAINKNFVIKNGVEVNTNLLVGDSTLNKVGIATTVPGYTLHIGVGDGARGGIGATDITVTGIATIGVANSTSGALFVTGISTFDGLVDANGGVSARTAAVQDLTAQRVVLAGTGGELEDSANLTFDGTTLTVTGDLDPTNVSIGNTLQVAGVATFLSGVIVSGISTFESDILPASDGAVDLGSSSKEFQDLFIDGTANIDTLAADTVTIGDLTNNRVVIVGTSGELEDDGNFTFDGSTLTVNGSIDLSTDIDVDGTANLDILDVDGASNFGADVVFAGAASTNITFDQSTANLKFDDNARSIFGTGEDFTVFHDGTNSQILNGTGQLEIISDDLELRSATSDEQYLTAVKDGAVELYHNNVKIFQTTGAGVTVGLSSVQHNGNAAFAGITTVGGFLLVNSGVSTFSDTTQSTSATTGAVVLDGGLGVAKNVNIGGNLTVTGTTTLNGGTVTLGDADTDNVVFSADVDSSITPDDDDTYDLGSSTKEWRNLFIDGTANIDTLAADTIAIGDLTDNRVVIVGSSGELEDSANLTFDGTKLFAGVPINVSTGATITNAGNAAFAGIVTANGGIHVGAAVTVDAETGNVAITGIATIGSDTEATNTTSGSLIVAGGLGLAKSLFVGGALDVTSDASLKGNVDLGDATSDTISLTGRVDTDIVPSTDGERDLGSSSLEFKDLFIDGTANIDSLSADTAIIGDLTDNRVVIAGSGGELEDSGNLTFDGSTLTVNGSIDLSTDIDVDGTANLDIVDVDGAANFADDVTLVASIGAGSSTILFDSSAGTLTFQDNIRANFGTGEDLSIYHNGTDSYIQDKGTGSLKLLTAASGSVTIEEADANLALFTADSGVTLYDGGNNARVTTNTDGVDIGGTGSIRVPNGTTAQRNSSPASGDFRYNTTTGKFEGYTDSWGDIGGSGGVEETDTNVNGTTAVGVGSFSVDTHRSASILAQIDQGANYQVGRYLMIHDGTTVTVIEESAVATGSMLGSFSGDINHSNAELKVTMVSSGIATVTTKIDSITV